MKGEFPVWAVAMAIFAFAVIVIIVFGGGIDGLKFIGSKITALIEVR